MGNPYKVDREVPSILQKHFENRIRWITFCGNLDRMILPVEEIKSIWMVLGILFSILGLFAIAGIICRYFIIDDDKIGVILTASLFGALFLIFTGYFFLMQCCVISRLDALSMEINEYLQEVTEKWTDIDMHFQRSKSWSIIWDADFKAWIDITSTGPVDLDP